MDEFGAVRLDGLAGPVDLVCREGVLDHDGARPQAPDAAMEALGPRMHDSTAAVACVPGCRNRELSSKE